MSALAGIVWLKPYKQPLLGFWQAGDLSQVIYILYYHSFRVIGKV